MTNEVEVESASKLHQYGVYTVFIGSLIVLGVGIFIATHLTTIDQYAKTVWVVFGIGAGISVIGMIISTVASNREIYLQIDAINKSLKSIQTIIRDKDDDV